MGKIFGNGDEYYNHHCNYLIIILKKQKQKA